MLEESSILGRKEQLIKFDWNNMTLDKNLSGGLFSQSLVRLTLSCQFMKREVRY